MPRVGKTIPIGGLIKRSFRVAAANDVVVGDNDVHTSAPHSSFVLNSSYVLARNLGSVSRSLSSQAVHEEALLRVVTRSAGAGCDGWSI